MYISEIHIENFRNFDNFTMDFQKGLNVIIGANNSGKTGLLYAINLLSHPTEISVDDFNKYNLSKFAEKYRDKAPKIVFEYSIQHTIMEDDTEDESIIKLLPFMGIKNLSSSRIEKDGKAYYNIFAKVRAEYSLDIRFLDDYIKEIELITDFENYWLVLKRYVSKQYDWTYSNGVSDTTIDKKDVCSIFDIRFIGAERTSEEVRKETKKEIEQFAKDKDNMSTFDSFKKRVSDELKTELSTPIEKLSSLFENEHNEIGLEKGNVSISSTVKADFSVSDAYYTEVKDTKHGYNVPLDHNGLGYNNLINIYMLIKLNEVRRGVDFRILCLEEPEAHLHPAMQYKLFKYLSKLDKEDKLNQQIFVTTHSSNISAVAGLENMFMINYNSNSRLLPPEVEQQSLEQQFQDSDGETVKAEAKKHLAKFLDVTRSDMLFADKVILVEGLAEKLMMPLFMEKCGIPYEDEHISIVEIGGKNFMYFVELFNGNNVSKKVLCITDNDFKWIVDKKLQSKTAYSNHTPEHINKLNERFDLDNIKVVTQKQGGKTFEDEFFLAQLSDEDIAKKVFEMVIPDSLQPILNTQMFDIELWKQQLDEIHTTARKTVKYFVSAFEDREDTNADEKGFYNNLIFAEMYLRYLENVKGDTALNLLIEDSLYDENGESTLIVPEYIKEGLDWLKS